MKNEKGSMFMLIVVVGIVIILITGTLASGLLGGLMMHLIGEELICTAYCHAQSTVEEVKGYHFLPGTWGDPFSSAWDTAGNWGGEVPILGHIGGAFTGAARGLFFGGRSSTEAVRDRGLDMFVNPKEMGCYCGIMGMTGDIGQIQTYGKGKYIHMYSWDFDWIGEFHLTPENPVQHLQSHIIDSGGDPIFSHTGAGDIKDNEVQGKSLDACKEAAGGLEELLKLEEYSGCVIFSVMADPSGDVPKYCSIYGFEEGTVLNNEISGTIADKAQYEDHKSYQDALSDDPIKNTEIGDTITAGPQWEGFIDYHRPSQRMLLKEYGVPPDDGNCNQDCGVNTTFELYAPLVCRSEERSERRTVDELDEACKENCKNKNMMFWASACHDEAEIIENPAFGKLEDTNNWDEDELCPDDEEEPRCMCILGKEYYWNVEYPDEN